MWSKTTLKRLRDAVTNHSTFDRSECRKDTWNLRRPPVHGELGICDDVSHNIGGYINRIIIVFEC
jgi:hypothetical protein